MTLLYNVWSVVLNEGSAGLGSLGADDKIRELNIALLTSISGLDNGLWLVLVVEELSARDVDGECLSEDVGVFRNGERPCDVVDSEIQKKRPFQRRGAVNDTLERVRVVGFYVSPSPATSDPGKCGDGQRFVLGLGPLVILVAVQNASRARDRGDVFGETG